ncbi:uncharacterized protein LOC118438296 [Folsomia candida]|uniref:uncharacterized protein LOC118438296 n=1 Tax=Folsomia candida TaxID=158441 RepID=UPI0016050A54|nr:uncharacterized protein LOC118438296 [Folsomia candida]
MYSVVEFPDEEAVEVVLSNWINPEGKQLAHIPMSDPQTYDNYLSAREAANLAQDTSGLESDSNNDRRVKKKPTSKSKTVLPETDSDSDHSSSQILQGKSADHQFASPLTSLQINIPQIPGENTVSEEGINFIPNPDHIASYSNSNLSIGLEQSSQVPFAPIVTNFEVEYATKDDLMKFQKVMVRHLVQIQQTQNEICKHFLLLKTACNKNPEPEDFSTLPPIPVDTVDGLKGVETYLEENKENRRLMISYLSLLDGKDAEDITRTILEKLMTIDLGAKFSRTGHGKNKQEFNVYSKINLVIIGGVRATKGYDRTTEHDINTYIAKWFRFAPFTTKAKK